MNRDQLLQRCCGIAGGSGTWETSDLSQFYHRFRPDGKGLAEVFDGIDHGDAIMKRIKAVMKLDGTTKGSMLKCRTPKPIDDNKAIALAKKAVLHVKKLADELKDDEPAEIFTVRDYEIKSGQLSKHRQNATTDDRICIMCGVVDEIMFCSVTAAAVMFEAAYTLVHGFLYPTEGLKTGIRQTWK